MRNGTESSAGWDASPRTRCSLQRRIRRAPEVEAWEKRGAERQGEGQAAPEIRVVVVSREGGEVSWRNKQPPTFSERAEELGDSLNDVAETLSGRLTELGRHDGQRWDLDEVQLSFSLALEAEAGVILARASSKAGFQASMTWRRSRAVPGA
jgi:hypothetical protein